MTYKNALAGWKAGAPGAMLQFGTLPEATPVIWAPFVPLQFGAAQTQPIMMIPAGTDVPAADTNSGPLT